MTLFFVLSFFSLTLSHLLALNSHLSSLMIPTACLLEIPISGWRSSFISSPSLLPTSISLSLSHFHFCFTVSEARSHRAPPLDLPPPQKHSKSSETSPDLVRSRRIRRELASSHRILARPRRFCCGTTFNFAGYVQFVFTDFLFFFFCFVLFFFFFFCGCYGEFFVAVI